MSFRLKTILGIAAIEAILLLALVWTGLNFMHDSNEEELIKRASTTATLFATTTKDAVLSTDLASLEDFVSEVLKNPGLMYARVIGTDGIVLAEGGDPQILARPFIADQQLNDLDDDIFDTYAEISEAGVTYGRVELGLSVQQIYQTLAEARKRTSNIAALEMALVALFSFVLGTYLTRQLKGLKKASERIAGGDLGYQVPVQGKDELAQAASAFNHMSRRLQQFNDELEGRVAQRTAELLKAQQRLETILNNAAEGIITFDTQGIIESFNQAAEKLFGYRQEEVVGKDIGLLIIPTDKRDKRESYLVHFLRHELKRLIGHEGEVMGRHKDGTTFPMALKISAMTLEGKQMYTGLVSDISERKAILKHLRDMAEHDGLTGLYNRSYFQQELERVVERVHRSGGYCCALLYIDLDNFKYINDTMGHAAGDRLIVEVARILRRRARKSDLIARFGGDEFTVLLYDTTPALAERVAESFRARLADYEFKHVGEKIHIGCSIGVNPLGPETKSAEEALSQADLACHLAKRGGRNRVHVFNPADAEKVTTMSLDMGWSRRIKEAIDKNRFALACQPIVNVQTREIESYEVLIRMLDDNDELIMPAGFLPAAERFGLAVDIDKWVTVNAIKTLSEQRKECPELCYSINLSAKTLADHSAFDLIEQKLKEAGLDPAALTFEVTETDAISDMAVAEAFLSKLQALGCRTALDDFGSGMSSFAYLKDLPVDIVKIDGRFVKNLAGNPVDQTMVKAMNDIAHALGKQTIAEFVENEESFRLLVGFGVDYGQGYHLGRPDVTLPCKAIADHAGDAKICKI